MTDQQHEPRYVETAEIPVQPRMPLQSISLTTQIGALTLSRDFDEIVKSLGEIQAAINETGLKADTQNDVLLNMYAPLPVILKALTPYLKQHGVTLLQPYVVHDDQVHVTTVFIKGKQYVSMTSAMKADNTYAQAIGSAVTYGCRYSIRSILGLAVDGGVDQDDDGNKASGVSSTSKSGTQSGAASTTPATSTKKPAGQADEQAPSGYSDKLRSYLKRVESSDLAGLTSAKSQVPAFKLGEKEEKILLDAIERRMELLNKEDPK